MKKEKVTIEVIAEIQYEKEEGRDYFIESAINCIPVGAIGRGAHCDYGYHEYKFLSAKKKVK